jgi:hypothetical protein
MLVQRWTGAALNAAVDDVWGTPIACNAPASLAATMVVSKLPGVAFMSQRMSAMLLFNTALSDADCTDLASYFNDVWGTTF